MYIQPELKERVELFLDSGQKHMGHALGITFSSFKKDEIKATMPVNENTIQPFGILHGGASVALAETLVSIGAWLNLKDPSQTAVGVEINANHIRSVKKGSRVEAVATPIQRGRKIHVWETKIYNTNDKLVCVSRCTLAIVDKS
ncbi:PaaI family thioesterase [Fodinibius salsisoli]|uniref:Hotdog fold thioesterase n=1 Tax=Fodinibius salsisoli TaxID=2820877 RepID=A0ABT3PJK6_9BACT|nr:hotdog fold thioesterase [Fodinibius salsisoli]MCW9706106.1 hotdog fold thioesterase [Fodinibius salsisoli]